MSEVNEALGALPEIAIAAGYAGGLVVDYIAGRRGDAKRTEAIHTQGVTPEEYGAYNAEHYRLSPIDRELEGLEEPPVASSPWRSRVIEGARKPLAWAMATTALVGVLAFHKEQPRQITNAVVEVDVDQPWNSYTDGDYTRIDGVVRAFESAGHIQIKAETAYNSTAQPESLSQIAGHTPNGSFQLPSAVLASLGDASAATTSTSKKHSKKHSVQPNKGLLVITDDDPLGESAQAVIQEDQLDGNVPIIIVNEGDGSDATAQDLKTIASQTHGRYYAAGTNPAKIVTGLEQTVPPKVEALPVAPQEDDIWLKIADGMLVVLSVELIRRRAELHFRGPLRSRQANVTA